MTSLFLQVLYVFSDNLSMSTRKAVFYTFAFFLFVLIVPQLCAQNEISMSPGEAAITRQKLVDYSKQFIGKPYASGGIGPNSFDCSGLIFTVSRESIGVQLPRTTKAMYSFCKEIKEEEREAGDLVFFKTTSSGNISHVGLYIGSNQFIHAASDGPNTGVIVSSLREGYWKAHYECTRRYLPASNSELLVDSRVRSSDNAFTLSEEEKPATYYESPESTVKSPDSSLNYMAVSHTNHSFLNSVIVDASLALDWSFFTPNYFRLNCRGFDLFFNARYSEAPLQPGLGFYMRYDAGTDNFQIPLVLSFDVNEYFRFFAGPVISIGKPHSPGDSDTKIKNSFFPGIIGACFSTPAFKLGKTFVSFIQDIHYTVFNETDGSARSFRNSIPTGLVFASGFRVTLPLNSVL